MQMHPISDLCKSNRYMVSKHTPNLKVVGPAVLELPGIGCLRFGTCHVPWHATASIGFFFFTWVSVSYRWVSVSVKYGDRVAGWSGALASTATQFPYCVVAGSSPVAARLRGPPPPPGAIVDTMIRIVYTYVMCEWINWGMGGNWPWSWPARKRQYLLLLFGQIRNILDGDIDERRPLANLKPRSKDKGFPKNVTTAGRPVAHADFSPIIQKWSRFLWLLCGRYRGRSLSYWAFALNFKGNSSHSKKMLSLILTLKLCIALSKINTSRYYFVSFFCNHYWLVLWKNDISFMKERKNDRTIFVAKNANYSARKCFQANYSQLMGYFARAKRCL